jgi:hypothetical protein
MLSLLKVDRSLGGDGPAVGEPGLQITSEREHRTPDTCDAVLRGKILRRE